MCQYIVCVTSRRSFTIEAPIRIAIILQTKIVGITHNPRSDKKDNNIVIYRFSPKHIALRNEINI
jgi:hypothetical protein